MVKDCSAMVDDSNNGRIRWSIRFLLFIAGLGGLLYGIDLGIIAGALPFLEATAAADWGLGAQQLSFIVAAVSLGTVLSCLFAGMLSDLFGRRTIMFLSGLLFVISIPMIAMANGYTSLLLGRLLQGVSGGLVGVVVPLYLAECLPAKSRGKGTALFQWLLTLGFVVAALIGLYHARSVDGVEAATRGTADSVAKVLVAKNHAWRNIFWMSAIPGVIFTVGALMIAESSRWLFRHGKKDAALAALLRTRTAEEAELELREMEETTRFEHQKTATAGADPLLSRKYVLPFVIACLILACNQATGIGSILAYFVNILNAAGLPGSVANWGDVSLKILVAMMTVVAVILIDRKGRKFLLMLGSGGIVVSLLVGGLLFLTAEYDRTDCKAFFQSKVAGDSLNVVVDDALIRHALATSQNNGRLAKNEEDVQCPMQFTFAYAYGPFTNVLTRQTIDTPRVPIVIRRESSIQDDGPIGKLFRRIGLNPFADPAQGQSTPLVITKALVGPMPSLRHGWLVALSLFGFIAFYSVGPGVCVWLALSELMPTRIRSNGMSIALLLNQFVATAIAAVFLPTVGNYGYAAMFFLWSGCTVVYFLTAAFLLPETKGKTLEEIEGYFSGVSDNSKNIGSSD